MTTITSPTPSGGASNPDVTAFDKGLALPNGAHVTSVGIFSAAAQNASGKAVREDSSSAASVTHSVDFSHPGGGWHDVAVDWEIPAAGAHYLGSWLAGAAPTNPGRVRRYHHAGGWGNRPVGSYTGWDGDTGNLRAMRAAYEGGTEGGTPGGGSPTGDGVWRTKAAALPYLERAVGVPERIVWFHPAWDDDYTQISAYQAQFEAVPNCVVVSAGEPTNNPLAGAGPSQLGRLKTCLDAVQAEWGTTLPIDVVVVSGGVPVVANYMAAYPGSVRRASFWVGIYDFAAWWHDNTGYRGELEAICGGPPSTHFAEYAQRSPRWTMDRISVLERVTVNSRSGDSVVPKHHQERMYRRFKGLAMVANFNSMPGEHAFTNGDCAAAIAQIS